ncbi:MAG TPA: 50S ribosomal protein L25 [Elusimicrobiota bacterium]|nr:50S ribosomal protein L25 [Elusimicrobiota bacterium]
MNKVDLNAQKRNMGSKGALNATREKGEIPAVLYGGKSDTIAITVNLKEIRKSLSGPGGSNVIVNLLIDGQASTAIVKEIQRNPISRLPLHIDFQRISLTEEIEVLVPIHLKGEPAGVKLSGGILEHILRELRVRCLPTAIPPSIDVDVAPLQINQGLTVKDLPVPGDVKVLNEPGQLVVNVVAQAVIEETPVAEAAAAGATEPEVIAKGKKPEEGAEGAPAADTKGGAAKAAAPKAPEGKAAGK